MGLIASLLLRTKRDDNCSINWFDLPFEMREKIIDEIDAETRCRMINLFQIDELTDKINDWKIKDTSTGWFDLPFELREMIIDQMDTKTRCRFRRCSKLCQKEAEESKYYLYSIDILLDRCSIVLSYGNEDSDDNFQIISFYRMHNSKTCVIFQRDEDEALSKIENGSMDFVMEKYGKEYIEKYKNSIREYSWQDNRLNETHFKSFNLNNLNKLRRISLDFSCNYVEISQLNDIIDVNKLFHMETVDMFNTNFEFDQILKFKGAYATFYSKNFDEQTILQYLKMWKNEEIHENIRQRAIYFERIEDYKQIVRELTEGYNDNLNSSIVCWEYYCKSKNNRTFMVLLWFNTVQIQWI